MNFLASTPIKSHGRLKASNCVVDNRWTLKITGNRHPMSVCQCLLLRLRISKSDHRQLAFIDKSIGVNIKHVMCVAGHRE